MAAMKCTGIKTCTKCDETKPVEEFIRIPKGLLGRDSRCKACSRKYQIEYLARDGVRGRYKVLNKRRYLENKRKVMDQQLVWYHIRKNEPARKAASRIRTGIHTALRGLRKSKPTFDLLGYSKSELAHHLEKQFVQGMSWANSDRWHIDHIVPVSHFIKVFGNTEIAIVKAWDLSNLRPLWAVENLRKKDKRTHLI